MDNLIFFDFIFFKYMHYTGGYPAMFMVLVLSKYYALSEQGTVIL